MCTFLAWGSYTKHSTVSGKLLPGGGLIKVYTPQSGIVIEQHVKEGQVLQAGDILYLLSSEHLSSTQDATQAAISNQVEQRQASLRDELQKTRMLQHEERSGLSNKIAGQQDLVKLAEDALQALPGIAAARLHLARTIPAKTRRSARPEKPPAKPGARPHQGKPRVVGATGRVGWLVAETAKPAGANRPHAGQHRPGTQRERSQAAHRRDGAGSRHRHRRAG